MALHQRWRWPRPELDSNMLHCYISCTTLYSLYSLISHYMMLNMFNKKNIVEWQYFGGLHITLCQFGHKTSPSEIIVTHPSTQYSPHKHINKIWSDHLFYFLSLLILKETNHFISSGSGLCLRHYQLHISWPGDRFNLNFCCIYKYFILSFQKCET